MKKIAILENQNKAESKALKEKLLALLAGRDVLAECFLDAEDVTAEFECLLVLGGDGTLLRAAKKVVDLKMPLLGINAGTLGYLAEVEENSLADAVEHLLADRFTIEERMMLEGTVRRRGAEDVTDVALNDVAIQREGHLRVVLFQNYVNDSFLNAYRADGIVFSTATGSTGYSLSAGGPIVAPEADVLLMTPVAPHTLINRSIVLPGETNLRVELGGEKTEQEAEAVVAFDGEAMFNLRAGDSIVVRKSERKTRLIKINDTSFLQVLREKMAGA